MKKKKKKVRLRLGRLFVLLAGAAGICATLGFGGMRAWAWFSKRNDSAPVTDSTAQAVTGRHAKEVSAIQSANALDGVDVTGFTDEELRACFYSREIDDKLLERLNNMGYADHAAEIPAGDLRYVRVLYRNFDNDVQVGEIMVNAAIAQDIEDIFYDLFMHKYQIGKMILPDAYGGRLNESFADNNTIGLCFGLSDDSSGSEHALGLAVDLNPLYNPMIRDNGKSLTIYPMEGQLYIDRTIAAPHYISADDYVCKVFLNHGFAWKGDSVPAADYKHFVKNVPNPVTTPAPEQDQGDGSASPQADPDLPDASNATETNGEGIDSARSADTPVNEDSGEDVYSQPEQPDSGSAQDGTQSSAPVPDWSMIDDPAQIAEDENGEAGY